MPPDGWLVASSALDMRTFLHAAVLEEQQLVASEESGEAPDDHQQQQPQTQPQQPHHQQNARGRAHGQRVKGLSARTIASLSPCLGVLNNIPFAVPFEVRVAIFRRFVGMDMQRRGVDERFGECLVGCLSRVSLLF